jgi:hypothetical protein
MNFIVTIVAVCLLLSLLLSWTCAASATEVECEELLTKEDQDFELSDIAVEESLARQHLAL